MNQRLTSLVWRRARRCCEYCQMPQEYDEPPFQIDHILARKLGGLTIARNLALACFFCNNHKGPNIAGRDPLTGRIVRLFHPRRDVWREYFQWSGPRLVGLTPSARATIAVLELNLPHRMALRAALIEEGVFPTASTGH
ncbi:MAG: HNH endonuclease [Acidobacteria bacterium]|nr:HNH endonuclease [Acidobacteriota bacterium]MBI3424864.1 HNH endonuclease [Acidobacteriota bacterium]